MRKGFRIRPILGAAVAALAVAFAVTSVSGTGAGSLNPFSGDVDCNGQANAQDALKILRYQAGLDNQLPPGCPPIGGTSPATATPVTTTPVPSITPTPGNLPPPQDTGDVNANGKARVTISNDSRYSLDIQFDGSEQRTIHMDACATCTDYYFPPIFCPEKGPATTIDLAPGSYTVTATTSDSSIGAFQGPWVLSANTGYFSCFIVVKSFGS
jgi:hypothetical protein